MFGEGPARPADNHSAIIEFGVNDVYEEYGKLKDLVSEFVHAHPDQVAVEGPSAAGVKLD